MRSKTRTVQQPLRRSPRKSASRALPVLVSQDDEGGEKPDSPTKTVLEASSDRDTVENDVHLNPRTVNNSEDNMDLDSLGLGTCIRCNCRDDLVLVCGERGCLIAVHEKCMRCDAKFDDSGRFRCPFCQQKLAHARVKETRKKVMEAKKALSRFLEGNLAVDCGKKSEMGRSNDVGEENGLTGLAGDRKEGMGNEEPGRVVGSSGEGTREGIGLVTSVRVEEKPDEAGSPETGRFEAVEEEKGEETEGSGKRVSDKKDDVEEDEKEMRPEALDEIENDNDASETEALEKPPKRLKRRAGKMVNLRDVGSSTKSSTQKKYPVLRQKAAAKKNASSTSPLKASTRSKFQAANAISIANFPQEKRKRLHWTEEEIEMLREGVQEYSEGNNNLPWRKILEYGRGVFHETRVPTDLKDKWRSTMVKEGNLPKRRFLSQCTRPVVESDQEISQQQAQRTADVGSVSDTERDPEETNSSDPAPRRTARTRRVSIWLEGYVHKK